VRQQVKAVFPLRSLSEANHRQVVGRQLARSRHRWDDGQVLHLHHLSERNQQQVHVRDLERAHRPQVSRPRHLNADNGQADQAQRRLSTNRVNLPLADQSRVRLRAVARRTIHRDAAEAPNVRQRARARARGQTSIAAVLNSERRRKPVILVVSRRRPDLLVKRAPQETGAKARLVNLADNRREVEGKLQGSSAVSGNQNRLPISRSAGAKSRREERHRRAHNNFRQNFSSGSGAKLRSRFFQRIFCRASVSDAEPRPTHPRQNPFDMATVSSVRPDQLEQDSLGYNSIFRELILMFEGGGRSHPAAIAIFRANHMIH
jgi:hypothetical protein